MAASWNGTPGEYLDLMRTLSRNCGCEFGLMGAQLSRCGAHALMDDQRALNGLLYARRIVDTLREEEWMTRRPAVVARESGLAGSA